MQFTYKSLPAHVTFGRGSRAGIGQELERLGITRAIVLSTPGQTWLADQVAREIGKRVAAVFPGAAMHTPVDVTASALEIVGSSGADGVLSVGGGSTIGLGKAIALRTDLPQLVVPTTFSGSEMTAVIGQTENGVKTTQKTMAVLPEAVIYDPDMVTALPGRVAGPSGMNAIAHSVEGLYAEEANPIVSMMAEESIRSMGRALPRILDNPNETDAWNEALYGAFLAGICLGSVGMAIHHKICHTLGGSFDLPHADIHCLMLPYSAAYNREAAPDAMSRIAKALDGEDGPTALYDLMQKTATKKSLKEFGLNEADLDRAADMATKNPYYNPRPVTREGVREMLQAAYEGRLP
jgi:alcohol dehydrogenase class IV